MKDYLLNDELTYEDNESAHLQTYNELMSRKYSDRGFEYRKHMETKAYNRLQEIAQNRGYFPTMPYKQTCEETGAEYYIQGSPSKSRQHIKREAKKKHRQLNIDYRGKVGNMTLSKEYDLWWNWI